MKSVPLPQWAKKRLVDNKESATPKPEFQFVPGFAELVNERVRASEVFQFNLPLMEAGAAMAFYPNSEVRRLCAAAAESNMLSVVRSSRFEVYVGGSMDPINITYPGWPQFMWEGEAWYRLEETRQTYLGLSGEKRMLVDADEQVVSSILCAPNIKVLVDYDEVPDVKAEVIWVREEASVRRARLNEWSKRAVQCNTSKQLLDFDPDAYDLLPYKIKERMNS